MLPEKHDETKHAVYLYPCYKKFTKINSQKIKRKANEILGSTLGSLKRPRLSLDINIYPKECKFCNKYRIQRNKESFTL